MSVAKYNAIAQGLSTLGNQMIQNQQMDAQMRREQSLLDLRRQWQVQDRQAQQQLEDSRIADERKFLLERDKKSQQAGIEALKEQRAFEAPERKAQLGLLRARTGLMQASAAGQSEQSVRGPEGDSGLTALEKEIPFRFRQDALESATGQAPQYFTTGATGEPPSVAALLELHPQVAQSLQIDMNTPLNQAMGKVQEAIYRDQVKRSGSDFSRPERAAGGLMGAGPMEGGLPDGIQEGDLLEGPDGRVYVVRNGQPVLQG